MLYTPADSRDVCRAKSGERREHRLLQTLPRQPSGERLAVFVRENHVCAVLTDCAPDQEYERIVRDSIREQLGL